MPFSVQKPAEISGLWLRGAAVALACFLAALAGPAALNLVEHGGEITLPNSPPRLVLPWRAVSAPSDWGPLLQRPTRYFADRVTNGHVWIDRIVAVFGGPGGENLVRSEDRDADGKAWTFNSTSSGNLEVRGKNIPFQITRWTNGHLHRAVWSFYIVDGAAVSDLWRVKLSALRARILRSRCASAHVLLSIESSERRFDDLAVSGLLNLMEPLAPYLCRTSEPANRSR